MARIIRRSKALSVSPLKASQPLGAALAMLGMNRAIPMLHGSQGCTAFAKVFLVRHFREPIPLQTTAMDQVSAVMGADENLVEGLATVCGKSRPDLIGVLTTGLSETEGADVERVIREFRQQHPEFADVAVVPVSTPDFSGSAETGFALAVTALIDHQVPESRQAGAAPGQVNILAGAALTPGDVECLKDMVEAFGLEPLMVPDLSGSLDGHLSEARLSALTTGGTPLSHLDRLGQSAATLVMGASMGSAAEHLEARTGVPNVRFDSLMGLEATDELMLTLSRLSGRPVPPRLQRERARLQDAMLDTHFMLGFSRVAIAADPDLLHGFSHLIREMGGEVVAAVAPTRAPVLERVAAEQVKIGDLEDLEALAGERGAQCLIANTHGVEPARRLGIPLLRAGFPQYDWLGGFQRTWIGYAGARQALFDLANLQLSNPSHDVAPYRSIYAHPEAQTWEEPQHDTTASSASDHAIWH
ncbi:MULTISPECIES: nitrogenase iron-molybdenum cofactor biosynthesis protein NifN [Ectothiorhodospira]|nr:MULTISPECIES: nitrogenase iron-molybdenum cofactor biosynthesis protein NifN [Ectothiorhodospira]MCG5495169.1 nitrogenase iron-molybdenum cofactor biosynthesis protein NifN [Ectothiorhodospira variabilis]MCG5503863.1 nitrogenase iron-molybdenum cofactor biosynthesis protein NifN [Ectothiorhodospira variabilis]MCG5507006.1 nitrogenase iron-molybdenum cofactor biosynthesis protein NifN [Ectothiorhodospira variabilis]